MPRLAALARLVLVPAFCLAPLSTAYAGDAPKADTHVKATKHAKRAVAESRAAAAGPSAGARADKKVVAVAEVGLVDLLHSGVGGEVGYFLTPNRILEADYLASDFNFLGFDSKIDVATARLKWFLGNSFYVQGGAGVRQMQWMNQSVFDTSAQASKLTDSSVIAELGLGNRWQWSSFTLGCDWVGYVTPVAKLSSSESFDASVTEDERQQNRDDFAKSASGGNLLLVRFHLGMAF